MEIIEIGSGKASKKKKSDDDVTIDVTRQKTEEKQEDNNEDYEYKNRAWRKFQMASIMMNGNYPFFADLLYTMRVLMTYRVPTMATDGYRLMFNPKFVLEELDKDELVFVITHELMHCILNHMTRRGGRDPINWNTAGDYAINMLIDNGSGNKQNVIGKKPASALWDEKYKNMTTEQIYDMLKLKPKAKNEDEDDNESDDTPREPEVGDYVQKKTSKSSYGVITQILADGTYEVEDVTRQEVEDFFNSLKY